MANPVFISPVEKAQSPSNAQFSPAFVQTNSSRNAPSPLACLTQACPGQQNLARTVPPATASAETAPRVSVVHFAPENYPVLF
jgi:hypothetical protein